MLAAGWAILGSLQREEFPDMQVEAINISVAYPQAAAQEIDQSICIKLNEEISGTEGVDTIASNATEGLCSVTLELAEQANKGDVLADVKALIDAVDSFPVKAERPLVTELKTSYALLQVALSSHGDEKTLKRIAQKIRRDLLNLDGISQVSLAYARPEEISIEVSELQLREHKLSMSDVAEAIRRNSIDLPGGLIKSQEGELLIRTAQQRLSGADFGSIVVSAKHDGTLVTIGDIAQVRDDFKDTGIWASLDGKQTLIVDIRRVGEEDVLELAETVRQYFSQTQSWLPDGVEYVVWQDESKDLTDRMDQLADSAISGLALIIITLSLFMNAKLAFWVTVGIPTALLGAVTLFPAMDVTISTFSVVAVMLVLGIVVDDAVVVGERVHSYQAEGLQGGAAAKRGTQDVSLAVVFGVLTTIATFLPLVFVSGTIGNLAQPIGLVAISILVFSLLESQLLLPSHLAGSKVSQDGEGPVNQWQRLRIWVNAALEAFVRRIYLPLLRWSLAQRGTTIVAAVGMLLITLAIIASGRVPIQFFPPVPGERIYASVTLPHGSPISETEAAIAVLTDSAAELKREIENRDSALEPAASINHVLVSLGKKLIKGTVSDNSSIGSHYAEVALDITLPEGYHGPSTDRLAKRWRELSGAIPNAVKQTFDANAMAVGKAIEIELRGESIQQLDEVSSFIKSELYEMPGVFDVYDTLQYGKQELQISLLTAGYNLGFNTKDLASYVATAFQGEEIQRIQRGEEEVRVMVRYPEEERASVAYLENMRIRSPGGTDVPFSAIARIEYTRGLSSIERVDGEKTVKVVADVDLAQSTSEEILRILSAETLAYLHKHYPGVKVLFAGQEEERSEAVAELMRLCLIALFAVYALLAIPLKSYMQPFVVMSAIPFGLVGAVAAHYVMGQPFVFFSLLGIVALSGVVVNASLVLIDRANVLRAQGAEPVEAIQKAALERFRPVFLTSTTTFIGLIPLISTQETSTRLLFVPIALSLSGGVLFSTMITLVLIPALYTTVLGMGRQDESCPKEVRAAPQ